MDEKQREIVREWIKHGNIEHIFDTIADDDKLLHSKDCKMVETGEDCICESVCLYLDFSSIEYIGYRFESDAETNGTVFYLYICIFPNVCLSEFIEAIENELLNE